MTTLSIVIATATTAEIVAFYNANCATIDASPVKKFSDRKTAERRATALYEALKAEAEKVVEAPKEEGAKRTRSEGIAASWKRQDVSEKRLTRNGVEANGVEYRSLRAAFAALNLPDSKHIPFRQILKASGKAVFTFGKTSVEFKLI